MALARHEVGDRHERRPRAPPAGGRRQVGAQVHHLGADRRARELAGSGARPRRSWPSRGRRRAASRRSPGAPTRLAWATWMMSGPWVETTRAGACRRVRRTAWPGGRMEWAWTTSNGQRACRRASARASVGAIHRPQLPYDHGREARRTAPARSGSRRAPSGRSSARRRSRAQARERRQPAAGRRDRRDRPAHRQHAHLGAGVARRQRLAVGPDAEHRIGRRGVPLGHDGDAHGSGL